MPNWCANYIDIKHDDPLMMASLMQKLQRAIEAKENSDGFFDQLKPCPPELLDQDLTTWGGNDDESLARQIKRDAMKEKYGFESWYDWRVENWGTKWDVRDIQIYTPESGDLMQLQFDTAWSPPIPIYELLKEQGYVVNAQYIDEGMGFAGDWRDGDDQCFSGRENLPDRLSHLWPEYDEEGELV